MHQAYIVINGVPTQISTFGRWIEEPMDDVQDIIIIIPGNPGINGFYDIFAKTIHDRTGFPVWCIGHAGHNIPKNDISLPTMKDHSELYGLKGQIQHKAKFLEEYIPKNARVHLIGHSIGSYIILELMDHPALKDKLSGAYLLFPTIEHMAVTKNGKFLTTFIKPIVWLVLILSWIFTVLPMFFQNILLRVYTLITGIPFIENLENIKSLIKPGVLRRIFFMAFEEMDQVNDRNDIIINRHLDKIKLYYGMSDGWAPGSYYDKIKNDIPLVNAQVCSYNHTFVLKRSVQVGYVVSDWIKSKQ